MVDMKGIHDFVERVVDSFSPERVILFGSYAKGNPSSDSDVDLLVILPFEGKPWHMASEMRKRGQPSFPMDLLVRTPDQVQQRIEMNDAFLREITEQGKVLYEAGDRGVGEKG